MTDEYNKVSERLNSEEYTAVWDTENPDIAVVVFDDHDDATFKAQEVLDRPKKDELRELVEEWRDEHQRRKNDGPEERAWGIGHERCADDLDERINDD